MSLFLWLRVAVSAVLLTSASVYAQEFSAKAVKGLSEFESSGERVFLRIEYDRLPIRLTLWDGIRLEWVRRQVSLGVSVLGYNIYRSTVSGGPYTQINHTLDTSYDDRQVRPGVKYYYFLTEVDSEGKERVGSDEAYCVMEWQSPTQSFQLFPGKGKPPSPLMLPSTIDRTLAGAGASFDPNEHFDKSGNGGPH